MNLSPTAQATLLLTSYFTKATSEDVKPLTTTEWERFALWLKKNDITPANLLVPEPQNLLTNWQDERISLERLIKLLQRGHSLALAVEKWQRAGLWVVTRSDAEYPKLFKKHLKTASPPVLFGCGNKALLNTGGLAVVGSRNVGEADLKFTEQLGIKAAQEGIAIISGAARGVDETAMLGAMHSDGAVVGVMADSLLKAATSAKWRKGLMAGNALLVSPFYPEASFNVGNAMARNKYIYCLATSALVIHSGKKGGTINGAIENLNKGWVPLWVKPTEDTTAANADLVKKGGHWYCLEQQGLNLSSLLTNNKTLVGKEITVIKPVIEKPIIEKLTVQEEAVDLFSMVIQEPALPISFYQLFIQQLSCIAVNTITPDELIEVTQLHKTQINLWLKQAVDEGIVKKLTRPVRYQLI